MMPPFISSYLRKRAESGPWHLEGEGSGSFWGAVVIPSLAEGESLFATLAGLARNPPDLLARFLVVVVVNNREDADEEILLRNRRDLERLAEGDFPALLRMARVDAARPGLALPLKSGGVGLARKIGFDLALPRLDHAASSDPLLVWLDADTQVDSNYLGALIQHFSGPVPGGAVLPFVHRPGCSPSEQTAITLYELYLRHYVLGLDLAGSPYAFHTVGSATACRASTYVRAGGMNRRPAGEDFYFLQQVAKVEGVAKVRGTVVRPASRPSSRVPFGTGAAVSRWMTEGGDTIRFYAPECFQVLSRWLAAAGDGWGVPVEGMIREARGISRVLAEFLEEAGLEQVWPKLEAHGKRRDRWEASFHGWFDGLKTLRLIHRLSRDQWPMRRAEDVLPNLMDWAGLARAGEVAGMLKQLRRHQLSRSTKSADSSVFLC